MADVTDIFTRSRAALAPLAGVSNSVFRRICVGFGAQPVMTEMVSADGFLHMSSARKTSRLLAFHDSERPIGFQLFGTDPAIMADAAQKALELRPDFIDINAGCPVKKVVAKGGGSALMRNPDLLGFIVERVAAASSVPVTVKIRSGWDHANINAVTVACVCEDAGAHAMIMHPRTRSQGFGGRADWHIIRAVKEAVSVPVIGSGDIAAYGDALAMLGETGADGVMIGRSAMGNPWIFRQVTEYLEGREVSEAPGIIERLELALTQLDTIAEEVSERFAVLNMRKFFGWYSRGARDGASFRREVFRAGTIDDVRRIVRRFQDEIWGYSTTDI